MFAIVRIRATVNRNQRIEDTLRMLGLHRANRCALHPDTPTVRGMIRKVENWVTWGEVDRELEKTLEARGGRNIRLPPPSRGYRSMKFMFPKGSLGYRGEKINDLLRRMV
ncbi:MAG: uL30 family ribosomal protein [Candidatus Aenigmarchaeota archaeon]|nr:uL30 family ribosomal protein [Candidatus Aenigmarchaeota archaeon]